MRPIGIGETLYQAIYRIIMRATGDQEKMNCSILQLCAGIEASIKGATHAMVQRRRDNTAPVLEERAEEE